MEPSAEAQARVDELIEAILTYEQPPLTIYLRHPDDIGTARRLGMVQILGVVSSHLVWYKPPHAALPHLFDTRGDWPLPETVPSLCGWMTRSGGVWDSQYATWWPAVPQRGPVCALCEACARGGIDE